MPRILPEEDSDFKPNRGRLYLELGGLAGLIGLLVYFLAASWRRWPDPLIDFGIQLYVPERILHGEVLYRDLEYLYGPLSQYFNAALFACFGSKMMVLVTANVIVFLGILAATYFLFRAAWGVGSALAAVAIFISVFGFSQYVPIANDNYATPYAHESTHGLLVCLLLVIVLVRWVEKATLPLSMAVGFLFGLTFVLKPEIMMAGGLSIATATIAKYRFGNRVTSHAWALMLLAAILPTALFTLYFAAFMPWANAIDGAGRAWTTVMTTTRFTGNTLQGGFLGFDHVGTNLEEHILGTIWASLFIGFIAASARLVERFALNKWHYLGMAAMAALILWLAIEKVNWIESGRCLTGLSLIYFVICLISLLAGDVRENNRREKVIRLLLATLALALMLRMVLNARIYQMGFYQAVLAAIMVPAVLMGELPRWIGAGRKATCVIVMGTLCLFIPGVVILSGTSTRILAAKTVVVGSGSERLYAFPAKIEPTGEIVNRVIAALHDARPDQTLLVLPHGVIINHLTKLSGPISPWDYYHSEEEERHLVNALEAHPPDFVVIISQDLRPFGLRRYGSKPNEGGQLLQWVDQNYVQKLAVGDDFLDPLQHGAVVLSRIHPK